MLAWGETSVDSGAAGSGGPAAKAPLQCQICNRSPSKEPHSRHDSRVFLPDASNEKGCRPFVALSSCDVVELAKPNTEHPG